MQHMNQPPQNNYQAQRPDSPFYPQNAHANPSQFVQSSHFSAQNSYAPNGMNYSAQQEFSSEYPIFPPVQAPKYQNVPEFGNSPYSGYGSSNNQPLSDFSSSANYCSAPMNYPAVEQQMYPQNQNAQQTEAVPTFHNASIPNPETSVPTEDKPVQFKKNKIKKEKIARGRSTPTKSKILLWFLLGFAVIALTAFLLIKLVFAVPKANTMPIQNIIYKSTHVGDALIVRNETVYDDESVQDIDYVAQEGSIISRGSVICYVYSTNYTTKEANTLQTYRDTIRDYEKALLSKQTSYDAQMSRLEDSLLENALQTRQLVQGNRGNMLNQEKNLENAITSRQDYFKKQYPSDLTLTRNFDNESAQQQKIDSWIQSKTAMQGGIISFYTDGLENTLSPELYESYSPEEVRRMINGELILSTASSRGKVNLYRIVQNVNYAVLLLMRDTDFEPNKNITYKLVFDQFTGQELDARVQSYTRSGGQLLLRLAVMGDVQQVLYTRTCKANLTEYTSCCVIPQNAIYQKEGVQGVFRIDGDQLWFVPVKLIHKENGNAYVVPVKENTLPEGSIIRLS